MLFDGTGLRLFNVKVPANGGVNGQAVAALSIELDWKRFDFFLTKVLHF